MITLALYIIALYILAHVAFFVVALLIGAWIDFTVWLRNL